MNEPKITKSMGILEAVEQYPESQRYFLMAGMSCFGCMAATSTFSFLAKSRRKPTCPAAES